LNGDPKRWVMVARIVRPRGNKGEVAADLLTDFPERLIELKEVFLQASGRAVRTEPRPIRVQSCWISQNHKGQIVFHFEGSDSIADAEKFRGRDVLLPIEQRVTLSAGQYFVDDLTGCAVFEACVTPSAVASSPSAMGTAPALLGIVRDVQFNGEGVSGTPILVIEASTGELLVPLAEDICRRIDIAARRIDVILPEGLRDLNEKQSR
jgi:16S rRNA processing protein RimM